MEATQVLSLADKWMNKMRYILTTERYSALKKGFPGGSDDRVCLQWGRHEFDPWVGKISWKRNGNPLQYSCLENPMDRRAWQATVHRVTKSWMWLRDCSLKNKRILMCYNVYEPWEHCAKWNMTVTPHKRTLYDSTSKVEQSNS